MRIFLARDMGYRRAPGALSPPFSNPIFSGKFRILVHFRFIPYPFKIIDWSGFECRTLVFSKIHNLYQRWIFGNVNHLVGRFFGQQTHKQVRRDIGIRQSAVRWIGGTGTTGKSSQ